jgi:hypothetical protein
MNWWKAIAANLLVWPALLLLALAWFFVTTRLTLLAEWTWCQFYPLGRADPDFCDRILGEAEKWIFAGFGIAVFGVGAWLGPWIADKWHRWRGEKSN